MCIPVVQAAGAVLGSALVICAGVSLGFFVLRVQPRRLTIPVGCGLAAVLILAVGAGIPGGTPPAAWTTALAAGAGLASLALIADSGRARIAGFVAIAVVLAGAVALPRLMHSRVQQDARERQLARLGFPLLLPVAAGYHASGADAPAAACLCSCRRIPPGRPHFPACQPLASASLLRRVRRRNPDLTESPSSAGTLPRTRDAGN